MKMMKKAAALLMTLMMVLTGIASLAEGAAVDTTWTEYSLWGYDHASIELGSQDGGCKVTVDWESSARETTEWVYFCDYDEASNTLTSTYGRKDVLTFADSGELTDARTVYEDGQAAFTVTEEGLLIWKDLKEDAGKDMFFVRLLVPKAERAVMTDAEGNEYDMFAISSMALDENEKVTAITGRFERVAEEDGMDVPAYLEGEMTFAVREDAMILVPTDPLYDPFSPMTSVDDLYRWCVDVFLEGREPEKKEGAAEIYLTVELAVNGDNEVYAIGYVYVPWQ